MIRVAMLSYWHVHATDYTKQAEAHPDTTIVAVWDEQQERGNQWATKLGVPFYESLDELLARDDIDGVVVDAPTSMHRDVMVKAAKAGKHIFTEKVLAPTLREANEIVAAVQESGVKLTVSLRRMNEDYCPPIRELLDAGVVGKVSLVRVRDAHDGVAGGWLVDHFFNKPETCGGALIDLGCHPMYLTRVFAGIPDSVSANFGFASKKQVEDNAVAVLRYSNGTMGVVETGFMTPFSPFSIEIYGTEGTILYGLTDNRIRYRSKKAGNGDWQIVETRARLSAFEQWVSHIQNGTVDEENLTIALDLTRLMEASNRSAEENRPIELGELQA